MQKWKWKKKHIWLISRLAWEHPHPELQNDFSLMVWGFHSQTLSWPASGGFDAGWPSMDFRMEVPDYRLEFILSLSSFWVRVLFELLFGPITTSVPIMALVVELKRHVYAAVQKFTYNLAKTAFAFSTTRGQPGIIAWQWPDQETNSWSVQSWSRVYLQLSQGLSWKEQ